MNSGAQPTATGDGVSIHGALPPSRVNGIADALNWLGGGLLLASVACADLVVAKVLDPSSLLGPRAWLVHGSSACIVFGAIGIQKLKLGRALRDWEMLDAMTSEAPPKAGFTWGWQTIPWDRPGSHLRFNARRMRDNAAFTLNMVLVSIVMALTFYTVGPLVYVDTNPLISSASRLVVGGLLIFFVQNLAGIYRYSIRMAAFYEGRAAALMIAGSKLSDVSPKEIVDWLAGDKVEFDKHPKAPTELAAEVAQQVAEVAAKVVKKE